MRLNMMGGAAALAVVCAGLSAGSAQAEYEPYVGEITAVGENFCPRGWAPADGTILAIQSNTALYSLIGCTYGGNCTTTFALPDLRGRAMIGVGQGPGLANHSLGQSGGAPSGTISASQMPAHSHMFMASSAGPNAPSPANAALPTFANVQAELYNDSTPGDVTLNAGAVSVAGGSQPVDLYQPYTVLNVCIAVQGVYPPRP